MAPPASQGVWDACYATSAFEMAHNRSMSCTLPAQQEAGPGAIPEQKPHLSRAHSVQQRKPLQPLKARSRFYWDSADWALGDMVEELPHAQAVSSRRTSLEKMPSRLSRCSSADHSELN